MDNPDTLAAIIYEVIKDEDSYDCFPFRDTSRLLRVSKEWNRVTGLVIPRVREYIYYKIYDDQLLGYFTHLRSLALDNRSLITDHGISKMTNLTNLILRHEYNIYGPGLESLGNLRTLTLSSNYRISNNSVSLLTNLTLLDLWGDNRIDTDELEMPNLKIETHRYCLRDSEYEQLLAKHI